KKEEPASALVPLYKERPKADINLIADRGGARSNKRNLFKKRTKQVYFADEEKRRLDIEEARPWVLEDDDESEVWTGSLEGGQSSAYVLFVLTDDGFKVVPVDRWYKFTPKLKYKTLTLDEAEEELKRAQKSEAQDRWIMHKRMLRLDVNADDEAAAGGAASGSQRGQGIGGGGLGSRSKLVEREIDDLGFDDDDDDDDDDEGSKGKAPKKRGDEGKQRGGVDEFDFEMEFDDDEELGDVQFEYNEEEATQKKDQRLKAGASGFGSEEEEDEDDVTGGNAKLDAKKKSMRKLLRKREGGIEYKSDDDDKANPYLTPSDSDSDEDEEEESANKKQEGDKPEDAAAAAASSSAAKPATSGAQQSGKSATGSASSSAAAAAAAAAKKRKRNSVAPTGHQHHQPHVRASSPASATSHSSVDSRKHFRANPPPSSGSPPPSADLITKQEIVDLIKSGVNTTKKLITCVRKKLKANPANKVRIQAIVKE
ncbi:transcription factor IIF subunit tfg1, partial [Coemansia aciculifera]